MKFIVASSFELIVAEPSPRRRRAKTHSDLQPAVQPLLKVIDEHRDCAVLAKLAGLDGVEIHGAAGYLPMQFLSTKTSPTNR
jgi:2,4-dienoyl-CoA reductase-like NADH-dependent reductase (Old Yellow Enzyme family)